MNKKKILMIAGPALPILIIGGAIAFSTHFFTRPMLLSVSIGGQAQAQTADPVSTPHADPLPTPEFGSGILIDLGSKVVNLADPGGYRFLKVGIVLELQPTDPAYYSLKPADQAKAEQQIRDDMANRQAIISDAVISCLSDKTFVDIFSLAGKEKLKAALLADLNKRLPTSATVVRIYFTDFVIN